MLIEQIKTHNTVNGFLFSTLEFFFIIIFLLPIALYYLIVSNYLFAVITIGIIANACLIPFFALPSLLKKEPAIGIRKLFDSKTRKYISKKYPHLFFETLIIVVTILIPFLGISLALREYLQQKQEDREGKD